MACEADLSELEQQQQEPLAAKAAPHPHGGFSLQRGVLAAAGLLLVGTAALALFAWPSTTPAAAGAFRARWLAEELSEECQLGTGEYLSKECKAALEAKYKKEKELLDEWGRKFDRAHGDYEHMRYRAWWQFIGARWLGEELSEECQAAVRAVWKTHKEMYAEEERKAMATPACKDDPVGQQCVFARMFAPDRAMEAHESQCKRTGDHCIIQFNQCWKPKETTIDCTSRATLPICIPKVCHNQAERAFLMSWALQGNDCTDMKNISYACGRVED